MAFNVGYIVIVLSYILNTAFAQSPLQYDIFEEEVTPVTFADLLREAGLRDKYSADIVAILRLEISPHADGLDQLFSVSPAGMLSVADRLDRDVMCPNKATCVINLDIKIQPVEYFDIIKVELNIIDKNDNAPSFDSSTFTLPLFEGPLPDVPHGLPQATDPDSPDLSIGSYELSGHEDTFSLQTFTSNDLTIEPQLKILKSLDRETTPRYLLTLYAMDRGTPRLTGSVTVVIDVTDTNDQYPTFDRQLYEATIAENESVGSSVITVRATDNDDGDNAMVEYAFASQVSDEAKEAFDINTSTGLITVKGNLDYEAQQDYTLLVTARDQGQSSLSSQTRVLVHLQDINDNPPSIELDQAANNGAVSIQENLDLESFVAYLRIFDPDSGSNGEFMCTIESSNFILRKLHQNDFTLLTNRVFDREEKAERSVSITCRDNGDPVRSSTRVIEVVIEDMNDNPPVFEQSLYEKSVRENSEIGETLMTIKATDRDIGNNGAIIYSILSSANTDSFTIDPVIGDIQITGPIDHEDGSHINLTIVATDQGDPPRNANTLVSIIVIDVDDEGPVFIIPESTPGGFEFSIMEHESANSFVDQVVATDKDSDQYNAMTYSIKSTSSIPFRIDQNTGEIYSTMQLNREEIVVYEFIVVATGNPPNSWQQEVPVTIRVADKNDHAPVFTFPDVNNNTAYVSSSLKQGDYIATVEASDRDEHENALLRFSMTYDADDVSFRMDELSGRITAARDFETDLEVVVLTVRVRDSAENTQEDTSYLNVIFSSSSTSKKNSDFNESIVIGIAVLAAVVVTILILAIVCLLRKHNKENNKADTSDYLKNCHEIMNANNIANDELDSAPPPSHPVPFHHHKNNLGNTSLDSSFHSSSVLEKNPTHQGQGQDNRGMVYDSDRGSFVVQPWKQPTGHGNPDIQHAEPKPLPEMDDSDSACSLEGDNSDSGRGSNDDSFPHNISRQPPIPQRHPVAPTSYKQQQRHSNEYVPTQHLEPGVHYNMRNPGSPGPLQLQRAHHLQKQPRQLHPDNKQYYDERVFSNGAQNRSQDRTNRDHLPAYHKPHALHSSDRIHIASPSPSLQHMPGFNRPDMQNLHRQQSLNLPDVPPRKSVHYCSQV